MRTLSTLFILSGISASIGAAPISKLPEMSLEVSKVVRFIGSCDASGAVALSDKLFAVADDEDNVIRVYDATVGGPPLMQYDLSYSSKLKSLQDNLQPPSPAPLEEMDIEAATEMNGMALWITSHGRDKHGRPAPDRLRFFSSSIDMTKESVSIISPAVIDLLPALVQHPAMAPYKLQEASHKAPKALGGLNIEGMTATPDNKLLLGFRNPVPAGRALLVTMINPLDVLKGANPKLDRPILLNLQERGIRGLSYWNQRYWIAAGHYGEGFDPAIFSWSGPGGEAIPANITLPPDFNPEAFFTPDNLNEFMLLSDDGNVSVGGKPCKRLKDAAEKYFRGAWLSSNNHQPNVEN